LAVCFGNTQLLAQGENNIWAFGKGLGFDFNSGSAEPIGTALYTVEGSASVCGKNGALKFYSDGVKVFNRNDKQMPNGYGLLTDLSMTQGVVIVPFVNDTTKYYLFVLHSIGTTAPHYLNYSVVDMSLDGGLGDVVAGQKNSTIDDSLSEKMIVTRAPNCAYWLMVHKGGGPVFDAFKIDASGIHTKPIASSTAYTGDGQFSIGEMKIAPDNKKIVLANWRSKGETGSIELFNFDSTTGVVSGYTLIDSSQRYAAYGIGFSPDNTKLYAAYGEDEPRPPYPLVQYDLNLLPNVALLRSSKTVLATAYNWAGIRAFRGKVYVIKSGSTTTDVCVINKPNNAGLACNFTDSLFVFNSGAFGLGNPVPETQATIVRKTDTTICTALNCSGTPGYTTYAWSDGYGGYTRSVQAPAQLWVRSSMGNCAPETIDTFIVRQKQFNLDLGADLVLCRDQSTVLTCPITDAGYVWSDGSTAASMPVTQTGTYWVKASAGDCMASDTIYVQLGNCNHCISIPNSFTPNADTKNDVFAPIVVCPVLQYQLKIFNRYGQEIFATNDAKAGWDGTFSGQQQDIGVYFYWVKVTFDKPGGTEELYKGDINLLR